MLSSIWICQVHVDQINAVESNHNNMHLGIAAGNWIEVAYGTATGAVCVIVQHPELVGQGFQLFQTFTVHRNPVSKVMLSERHLVSGIQIQNNKPLVGFFFLSTIR